MTLRENIFNRQHHTLMVQATGSGQPEILIDIVTTPIATLKNTGNKNDRKIPLVIQKYKLKMCSSTAINVEKNRAVIKPNDHLNSSSRA